MRASRGTIGTVLVALLLGCGAGETAPDDTESSENATAPEPGASQDGWRSAWNREGKRFSCDATSSKLRADGVPHVQFEDATLFVGFEQKGDNQNPVVARYDGGEPVYCVRHETQPPDSRALGVTWNGGERAYIVYSVVGGGTSLENHDGWLDSYAPGALHGGGAKVSFLARADVTSGALEAGTFVVSVLSDGGVNTHRPRAAPRVSPNGRIEFLGSSAHKPVAPDGDRGLDCTDYPFETTYRFSADLDRLVCAESSNCTSPKPCSDAS